MGTECNSARTRPIGWVVGATYFGADIITKGITGKSIGNHLDEYVEKEFDKDNGTLINIYGK